MPREQVPKVEASLLRYSDFLCQRDAETETSTVLVSNLPDPGPISKVIQMIEKIGLDDNYGSEDDEPRGVKEMRHVLDEGIVVRFYFTEDADSFRHFYNGGYWENNTLYIRLHHGSEMEELLHRNSNQNTKLFVGGVCGLINNDTQNVSNPIALNEEQIDPSGFAFIFLSVTDAVAIVDKYPKGMRLRTRRNIWPLPPKDKKGAAAFAAARAKMASNSIHVKITAPLASNPLPSGKPALALPSVPEVSLSAKPIPFPQADTFVNK
jgi:hypothetical protein